MTAKELKFSEKYTSQHSQKYFEKHQSSIARRLSNFWEQHMAAKALKIADNPDSILDLPCGAGRFWPLLTSKSSRTLFAADNSKDMLAVADAAHPEHIRKQFTLFQSSAFAIDMEDKSVDSVFCMRLLHHIGKREDRIKIYQEFARVARDSIILSLWVDGNYKAKRRKQLEAQRSPRTINNRSIRKQSELPLEFLEAGLEIVNKVDFLPKYALWRTYILRPINRN